MNKEKWFIAGALIVFFILRIFSILYLNSTSALPEGDGISYNGYALAMFDKPNWLTSASFIGSEREPGFPAFIASVYLLFGKNNVYSVLFAQALLSTVTVFVIYRLSLKFFGFMEAHVALFLAGISGYYLYYCSLLLRETLVCLLFILFIDALYDILKERSDGIRSILMASIILFFIVHADLRYIYLLPCAFALLVFYKGFARSVRNIFIIGILFLSMSIPWGVRNYLVYQKIVPVSIINLNAKHIEWISNPEKFTDLIAQYRERCDASTESKGVSVPARGKYCSPDNETGWAGFIKRVSYNLIELYRPFRFRGDFSPYPVCLYVRYSMAHNIMSILSYGIFIPFICVSIIYMTVKREKRVLIFLLPISFHTVIHSLVWGEERYRIPVDSLLMILAGHGICLVYLYLIKKIKCQAVRPYAG